jgi:8-oxo-dGTP pyrophosphatase MutT (NUDIX family)
MPEPYRRVTARVLLVDAQGRLLLMRFRTEHPAPALNHGWLTPGGGVDEGETLAQAAARELGEEIGLTVSADDLGAAVAYTAGYANLGWATGVFRDDFFFLRVDSPDIDTTRMQALERSHHVGHRWWTLDELASTTETVYPFGLAGLVSELIAGRVPSEPVELPWHH